MFVKFQTNLPTKLKFQYDHGLFKEGKFGPQWNWGVKTGENLDVDGTVSATETLNNILETLKPFGRTLEILKYEDGTRKLWKILENGTDITPQVIKTVSQGIQQPLPSNNTPTGLVELSERLNKAADAFTALENRLNALEVRVGVLEMEILNKI